MSDTPISDSTPHNVADLGMLCRRLERELNAANSEIERLTNKVSQLYEGAEEAKRHIKRLEEAGDYLDKCLLSVMGASHPAKQAWHHAKEVKP